MQTSAAASIGKQPTGKPGRHWQTEAPPGARPAGIAVHIHK